MRQWGYIPVGKELIAIFTSVDLESTMDMNNKLKEDALKQLKKLQQAMKVKKANSGQCLLKISKKAVVQVLNDFFLNRSGILDPVPNLTVVVIR